jgi:hypothetical protein
LVRHGLRGETFQDAAASDARVPLMNRQHQ